MSEASVTKERMAGNPMAEQYLRCEASPGQFPGELAITGATSSGTVFSLFMPESLVFCEGTPLQGSPVGAWLPVQITGQQNELWMVRLPRQTLETGQFVEVKANQLQQKPDHEST